MKKHAVKRIFVMCHGSDERGNDAYTVFIDRKGIRKSRRYVARSASSAFSILDYTELVEPERPLITVFPSISYLRKGATS